LQIQSFYPADSGIGYSSAQWPTQFLRKEACIDRKMNAIADRLQYFYTDLYKESIYQKW
jgi:hypothetical protein